MGLNMHDKQEKKEDLRDYLDEKFIEDVWQLLHQHLTYFEGMGDGTGILFRKEGGKEGGDRDINKEALQHVRCGKSDYLQQEEQAFHFDLQRCHQNWKSYDVLQKDQHLHFHLKYVTYNGVFRGWAGNRKHFISTRTKFSTFNSRCDRILFP
jgi:hypothetical protein